jgi:hypothetical protein
MWNLGDRRGTRTQNPSIKVECSANWAGAPWHRKTGELLGARKSDPFVRTKRETSCRLTLLLQNRLWEIRSGKYRSFSIHATHGANK